VSRTLLVDLLPERDEDDRVVSQDVGGEHLFGGYVHGGHGRHGAVTDVLELSVGRSSRTEWSGRVFAALGLAAGLLVFEENHGVRWRREVERAHVSCPLPELRNVLSSQPALGPWGIVSSADRMCPIWDADIEMPALIMASWSSE